MSAHPGWWLWRHTLKNRYQELIAAHNTVDITHLSALITKWMGVLCTGMNNFECSCHCQFNTTYNGKVDNHDHVTNYCKYIEYIVHSSKNGLLYDLTLEQVFFDEYVSTCQLRALFTYWCHVLAQISEIWANTCDTSMWTRSIADGSKRHTHLRHIAPK